MKIFLLLAFTALWAAASCAALFSEDNSGTQSYEFVVEQSNPAAHFKMDDLPTHNMRLTESVSSAHGSIVGYESGATSLQLSGTDAIETRSISFGGGGHATLPISTVKSACESASGFAFELWVKPVDLPVGLAEDPIFHTTGCSGGQGSLSVSTRGDGRILASFGGQLLQSSVNSVFEDEWAHVVVSGSPDSSVSSMTLYVNGHEVDTADASASELVVDLSCSASVQGDVVMEEVAVYNHPLSLTEIQQHYDVGLLGGCRKSNCFSGVECTPNGASDFVCGDCPQEYSGDGVVCEPLPELQTALGCQPTTPEELANPAYCSESCTTRTNCYACTLNYHGTDMWDSRRFCRNETGGRILVTTVLGEQFPWNSATPSPSSTPSVTALPTPSPSASPPAGSISGCTDPGAVNYHPNATIDDGSCTFAEVLRAASDPTDVFSQGCVFNGFSCLPPEDNNAVDGPSLQPKKLRAESLGDPHYTTFSGVRHDNYQCGDFLLMSCDGAVPVEVYGRQIPYINPSRTANGAIAIRIPDGEGGYYGTVSIFANEVSGTPSAYLDCDPLTISEYTEEGPVSPVSSNMTLYINKVGNRIVISLPNGLSLSVYWYTVQRQYLNFIAHTEYSIQVNCDGMLGGLNDPYALGLRNSSQGISGELFEVDSVFPSCVGDLANNAIPDECQFGSPGYVPPVVPGQECDGLEALEASGKACCGQALGDALIGTQEFEDCVHDVCLAGGCQFTNSYSEVKTARQDIDSSAPAIDTNYDQAVGSTSSPGASCLDILERNPRLQGRSGVYVIEDSSTSQLVSVYCDMVTDGGGWTRVAIVDADVRCPTGYVSTATSAGNVCSRSNDNCSEAQFSTYGIEFGSFRGSLTGLQYGSPDAFGSSVTDIDDAYVDGVSVTAGSPRQHIWTYGVGFSDDASAEPWNGCPCAQGGDPGNVTVPSFISGDYICESGNILSSASSVWYNTTIFAGNSCLGGSSCCAHGGSALEVTMGSPLSANTVDVRICADESRANEDIGIKSFSLFGRERAPELDSDFDGISESYDNCPNDYNPSQADSDSDGIGNACDSCKDQPGEALTNEGDCVCPDGYRDNGNGYCIILPSSCAGPCSAVYVVSFEGSYLEEVSGNIRTITNSQLGSDSYGGYVVITPYNSNFSNKVRIQQIDWGSHFPVQEASAAIWISGTFNNGIAGGISQILYNEGASGNYVNFMMYRDLFSSDAGWASQAGGIGRQKLPSSANNYRAASGPTLWVFTLDPSGALKLYSDGVLRDTAQANPNILTGGSWFPQHNTYTFGSSRYINSGFKIYGWAIWPRALTPSEVSQLHANGPQASMLVL